MKLYFLSIVLLLVGCSRFQAKRVDGNESDERALEITDEWVQRDTERVVAEIVEKLHKHKGVQRYLKRAALERPNRAPALFVGEVQNLTSNAYFPINDLNDELLNGLSERGDFVLVDEPSRKALLKELSYQRGGGVAPSSRKVIGKQTGADLMIFGNVYMKAQARDGKTIKQYSINLRLTDLETGQEVARARAKISKFSDQDASGW